MKTVEKLMEVVSLYDHFVTEDNRESSWKADAVAEARKNYMNAAIAMRLDVSMLSKLSHMEHCHNHTVNKWGQMRPELYREDLVRKYPELLEWYATYMDHENDPVMATKFRSLLKEVAQNVAA